MYDRYCKDAVEYRNIEVNCSILSSHSLNHVNGDGNGDTLRALELGLIVMIGIPRGQLVLVMVGILLLIYSS